MPPNLVWEVSCSLLTTHLLFGGPHFQRMCNSKLSPRPIQVGSLPIATWNKPVCWGSTVLSAPTSMCANAHLQHCVTTPQQSHEPGRDPSPPRTVLHTCVSHRVFINGTTATTPRFPTSRAPSTPWQMMPFAYVISLSDNCLPTLNRCIHSSYPGSFATWNPRPVLL